MVESENDLDNYKALEIIIGAMMKNSEILKFVTGHLKK